MANTERLNALQRVRLARNAVQDARATPGLPPAVQADLSQLYFDLDDLEDSLILEEISQKIEQISADAQDLAKATEAIKAASDKLAKEVALVEDAAKAVEGLLKIVSTAASAGLL